MKVAIVGRPNTGKSSLFNRLAGKNKAVTDDLPGVTRDRLFVEVEHYGCNFELIDTGGYEWSSTLISQHIVEQINIAVSEADIIVLVVDVKDGLTDMDKNINKMLRKSGKTILLVVNKVDNDNMVYSEFYKLGFDKVFPVSCSHALGFGDLIDEMTSIYKSNSEKFGIKEHNKEDVVKVAIAGRPNTGKSTLLNAILGEKRVVTSEIPGTTRDVVDSLLVNEYGEFLLLDTAGIRKFSKTESKIESYSIMRTKKALDNADVSLLVIDGEAGLTTQDKKVAELIQESGLACIIVINKKDKMPDKFTPEYIKNKVPFVNYAPLIYTSAIYDKNFSKLFKTVIKLYKERKKKISTGELNRFFQSVVRYKTPPMVSGKEVKLKYIVQASKENGGVPRFIVLGKNAKMTHSSYKKFLVSKIREEFGFDGNPIQLIFKEER